VLGWADVLPNSLLANARLPEESLIPEIIFSDIYQAENGSDEANYNI
jgi:hypothetical protein